MARGVRTYKGQGMGRTRSSLARSLSIQPLETRMVLSGLSLLDVDTADHTHSGYHQDAQGNILHVLPVPTQNVDAPSDSGAGSNAAATPGDALRLHSNPGALKTIYLDFDGHTTSGTSWNNYNSGADIVTPAFNFTGDASFADSELNRIYAIWERVAEDFIPFDVNVTTEQPSSADLTKSGSGDDKWGVRVVIGGDGSWFGSAGGVAYVGSFNWSSDTPVFVFEDRLANGNEKYTAEAISHEAGHALGLNQDGRVSPAEEYYGGSGSGATGWAPIMGVSYYKELTQWSRGEYTSATNRQDDLAIITSNNGFGYRADDHADSSSSATVLDNSTTSVAASGIIETNDDVDVFTFLAETGDVQFEISPFYRSPNLDIAASLFDAAGSLVISSNPVGLLSASLSATLAAGQYYLHVTGAGQGDPTTSGYSDYGSLGSYSISGSVVASNDSLISVSANAADQSEGDAGSRDFTFNVSRSGDASVGAAVNWTVAGSGAAAASASDFTDGVLPSGTVTFAPGETSKSIAVRVAGDTDAESDETFNVVLSDASTGNLIATSKATGTIRNDDAPPAVPGITISPIGGLTTSESGGSASFSVVLQSRPAADVVISIASSNTNEGVTDVSSLTFTSSNWASSQTVRVTGVDDAIRDGNVSYTIVIGAAVSQDSNYDGMDAADLDASNQDNEKGKRESTTNGGGGGGGGRGKKKAPIVSGAETSSDALAPSSDNGQTSSAKESSDPTVRPAPESVDGSSPSKTKQTWLANSDGSRSQGNLQADSAADGTSSGSRDDDSRAELIDSVWSEFDGLSALA